MNFLITGLPRSKTAWMSAIASTVAGAICYHEPMSHMKSWECCFDLWNYSKYRHVGVADAHLGFHLREIMRREPNLKVLIIRRDATEVEESLAMLGFPPSNYCSLLCKELDRIIHERHPRVAVVDFEMLNKVDRAIGCLGHLMPGCSIDETRVRQLMDFNIQADMNLVWQRAIESRGHTSKILGAMPELQIYQ